MNRWTVLFVGALFLALFAVGCSGGGVSPVTPDTGSGLTTGIDNHGTQGHEVLWGYYDLYFDFENGSVEAVPNRDVAFTANVTMFVNNPASNLAFVIHDTPVDPDFIDVDIDVSISHPFPGLHQYDGWDVRGIFIGAGSGILNYDNDLMFAIAGNQEMYDYNLTADDPYAPGTGHPDGYTRWWNAVEFGIGGPLGYVEGKLATPGYASSLTATLNPYKYFCDELGPEDDLWTWLNTDPNADGHGIFTAGATNTRNYYLRFPMPDPNVKYGYAIAATWGEAPGEPPPAYVENAVESIACTVSVTDNIYYVDDLDNGGNLIADIDLWLWDVEVTAGVYDYIRPSTVYVESDLFGGAVDIGGTPVGGGANWSTYSCDIPATNITSNGIAQYWVIAEYGEYDYTCQYPSTAPEAPLAAFFKFDLDVLDESPCDGPEVTGISPPQGSQDTTVNATISGTFDDGTKLGARLKRAGQPDMVGYSVTWQDANTITASFDIPETADLGFWDLSVTHGECSSPTVLDDAFEVVEFQPGLVIDITGNLPTPFPTSTNKHMCVQGESATGNAGVYYHYSTGPSSYLVYRYPLDYSSAGVSYRTLSHWMGMTAMFNAPSYMGALQVTSNGVVFGASDAHINIIYGGVFYEDSIPWWTNTAGAFQIGLLPWTTNFANTGIFEDWDQSFGLTGDVWGFWSSPSHMDLYYGNQFYISAPWGSGNYVEFVGYFPWDYSGGVDGLVDDTYASRLAVDSAPQGLSSPWDIIHYYLESRPGNYAVEVFENLRNMALPVNLTTIDSFVGTPIDITVYNGYGYAPGATGNWLAVLEDNGSDWQVALYAQDGTLITRYATPIAGTPKTIDCDTANHKIHVWYDDGGTMKYTVFIYQ